MGKLKAYQLRTQTKNDLLKQLEDLKTELSTLRVAQVTSGPANKIGQIYTVRKNIARVLTVINQTSKQQLREKADPKFLPRDLRVKKTRAIRRRLTPEQAAKKTVKQAKKDSYFPKRVYAIKAV